VEGYSYALLIVDEFSSYTWGRFLQHKGQAAEAIIAFIKEKERGGRIIAKVRSDRGGEFSSIVLCDFFQGKGIVPDNIQPTPHNFRGRLKE
jgi:hypothetical protein